MVSDFGKALDPLADKLTQVVFLFALYVEGWVPKIIFVVLAGKEFLMMCGTVFLKKYLKNNIIPANKFGKLATGLFYISVGLLLLGFREIAIPLLYVTMVSTVIAFISYSVIVYGMLREQKKH